MPASDIMTVCDFLYFLLADLTIRAKIEMSLMVSIVQNTASKDIRTIIECFVFEAVLSQG